MVLTLRFADKKLF